MLCRSIQTQISQPVPTETGMGATYYAGGLTISARDMAKLLAVLDEAGLAHVGTYRSQVERDENSGIYVADVGGISVAFLSYYNMFTV